MSLLALSSSKRIVSSFDDNTIKIFDISIVDHSAWPNLKGHSDRINALTEIDEQTLSSGSCDRSIRLWDLISMRNTITIQNAHASCINALNRVDVGQNEFYLISVSDDKTTKVWRNLNLFQTLNDHTAPITASSYLKSNRLFATGSKDHSVRIYTLSTASAELINQYENSDTTNAMIQFPNGLLFSASADSTIKVWNSSSFKLVRELTYHTDVVRGLELLPNGNVVSCSNDKTILIWNPETFNLIANLTEHTATVKAVVVSFINHYIVSGSSDLTIKVWNSTTFKCIANLTGHTDEVYTLTILPSNDNIISGSRDSTIKVWDSKTFKLIANITGHKDYVLDLAIIPLSQNIVSASNDRTVKIWDSNTFELITTLYGHINDVFSLKVAPQTKNIISGSSDGIIIVWNSTSFQMIQKIQANPSGISSLLVLKDNSILSGTYDSVIQKWSQNSFPMNLTQYRSVNYSSAITALAFFNFRYLLIGSTDAKILVSLE